MQASTPMGLNRTGIQMSPLDAQELEETVARFTPHQEDSDGTELETFRSRFIAEAEPLGSIPLPGTFRGTATVGMSSLMGKNPATFMDKIGERLAFERTGTRLYDALLTKFHSADAQELACLSEGAQEDELQQTDLQEADQLETPELTLQQIRAEELAHLHLIEAAFVTLGADPTAQTPSADLAAVISQGLLQVLTDPRTNLAQCLEAILTGELTDNAGWELLIELAEAAGQEQLAEQFSQALADEERHLTIVKDWLARLLLAES
jgi:rubrerythrin